MVDEADPVKVEVAEQGGRGGALDRRCHGTPGAADPYAAGLALMACCEGIILHRIARHDDTDARPLLQLVVNAALQ